ncbi:signal peptide peptidase SppA [Propioniciclava soli]|uniref:signal peptide peptidase SppA n=1 Tax=Propioniciclava soli TaxID=2775081 RepID=UPI001E3BFB45|nr:signal peptide peptidase SppA [Propioniciclava soli]
MKLPSAVHALLSRLPLADQIPGGPGEQVILELDLGRGVAEAAPNNPIDAIRGLRTPQLRTLVEHLRKAETDATVVGLVGVLPGGGLTFAQSDELRAAVTSFARSGKPTLAFSPTFGELGEGNVGYHLAAAFDEIWLQPSSGLGLVGFTVSQVFLRGAFDKLGVQPEFGQRYEYKTAADRFTRTGLTEPNAEMLGRLVDSLTERLVADVAADRDVPAEEVRRALADAPLTPEDAVARGLIDHVGYRDEAYAALRTRVSAAEPTLRYVERHGVSRFHALAAQLPTPSVKPGIAVIEAIGAIEIGHASTSPNQRSIGSDTLGAVLRAAAQDDHVAGVVLRIDSPGGSAVASDALRRDILQLRASGKPVVASMASVAASGGYYLAMGCERIVAAPGTLTGSIGVLAGKFVVRDALAKVGVNHALIAGSPRAAILSSDRPFDDDEWAILDAWLDRVYDDFTAKAAHDRGMAVEDLRAVARGRVWSGADAAERGLVDRLGGLGDAIDEVCSLLGRSGTTVPVMTYPRPHPLAAFQPPESSESVAAAMALAPAAEGPRLWRLFLGQLTGTPLGRGLAVPGVLSLPPMSLPGVLP